jgi:hypothetical protein
MGTTEEVAGGVIRAVQGAEVEAGVVGATRSMEGEARVVVAMRRAGEVVRVIKRAVRWLGGWSDCQPPQRGWSDRLEERSDRQPLQRGWLDCLVVWSDHWVESWSH